MAKIAIDCVSHQAIVGIYYIKDVKAFKESG